MDIRRKIEFTGKNLHDVFNLPCVRYITRDRNDNPVLILLRHTLNDQSNQANAIARIGSVLVEYENQKWEITKK